MAINDDVPGLAVTVRCHERPLHELEDPNSHDDDAVACPTTSKYIECVDDTEFDLSIVVDSTYHWGYRNHILIASTYVDGKHIRGSVIRSRETDLGGLGIRQIKGQEVCNSSGLWSVRKFKFAPVKTIDDAQKERVESDLKVAKTLGTIEIKFMRAIEYGPGTSRHNHSAKSGTFELAEKSLKGKAVSHGTSYGVCEAIPTPSWVDARDIVEDNGPILVFKFMYRSRDALKRELIIPRSPSRSPTLENMTSAERDRLARERLNELRDRKVKRENRNPVIKREVGEVVDLTEDPPAPRPTKRSRLQDGREVDVVDLTDD
ncbi:hypothetical protein E0Z10_g1697 [Xylaria hypoxylon]|uniref:DUF7918 domain-containing protein n=1 Tax=Xylaria hypoxylon TaxID=37992 RepID=A0A4Z0ZC26_9PEZI|nr:hypothetical protein E0Z10_g1697 [Xylaria hypoxylon]